MIYGNDFLDDQKFITEETVYSKDGICISVDAAECRKDSFAGDPYIKIYNGKSYSNATKVARVSLKTGKPVHHSNPKNLDEWVPNSKDIKMINNALNNLSTNKKYSGKTVIDALYSSIENQTSQKINKFDNIKLFN